MFPHDSETRGIADRLVVAGLLTEPSAAADGPEVSSVVRQDDFQLQCFSTVRGDRVDQILAAREYDAKADTSALERQIDKLVYRLFGLTPAEIKLVEEGTGK